MHNRDTSPNPEEISLDPENWDNFSKSAHRALDAALEHMKTASERPWRSLPDAARSEIDRPTPREGEPLDEVLAQVERSILPYPTGNAHPRFWGWVMGGGTPEGAVADMIAASMNSHLAGYDQSASTVERRVIRWMNEIMGFPEDAGGLLVSGGTMANLNGLAVARHAKAGFDVRNEGLAGKPQLRAYGSAETHSWAEKSCDLLGMGRSAFRRVAVDAEGRVDLDALRAAIHEDRAAGDQPICVVGNAGTVNAGVIDDFEALAALCREENLWLHVDGAFGSMLAFSPKLRDRLRGMELADSIAFDLHKWGYLQYEVGCVLVRDRKEHLSTFETRADYLKPPGRGIQPERLELADLGIQLSRGFRALKVWVSLSHHGTDKIGRIIEQNVAQANYLAERVEAHPHLELLAPAPLNVVCFRYRDADLDDKTLDALNREILMRLQENGVAVPSSTFCDGRFAIRAAITNHRTRMEDIDVLVDAVLAFADEIDVANV